MAKKANRIYMHNLSKVMVAVAMSAVVALAASAQNKLGLGDAAPPIKAGKWIKGEAVNKFESGNTYVVEFWATWCGPCRVSIPHLTEIAKKFKGKATIVGMSVWERTRNDVERYEQIGGFVNDMGEKMDYVVGADTSEGFMAKQWMEAAGEGGVPTAFIVNKEGKIAWIGHPMDGMEEVLEKVVAGSYDLKAAKEKRDAAKAGEAKREALFERLSKLREERKFKEAAEAAEKAMQEDPELAGQLRLFRIDMLFNVDEAAAVREVGKLADGELKENARGLSSLVGLLLNPQRKSPDTDLAVKIALRVNELTKQEDPYMISLLADAYFAQKNYEQAISAIERALKELDKLPNASEQNRRYLNSRLEKFKQGKEAAKQP